jgi:hypothetical protein
MRETASCTRHRPQFPGNVALLEGLRAGRGGVAEDLIALLEPDQ